MKIEIHKILKSGKRITAKLFREEGLSAVEAILAMGIFCLLLSFIFGPSFQSLAALERSRIYYQALLYLEEGEQALRYIAADDWSAMSFSRSGILAGEAGWSLRGEGSSDHRENFSRIINFSDVYRDDEFVQGSFSFLDEKSKYAEIRVDWEVSGQRPLHLYRKILLSSPDF